MNQNQMNKNQIASRFSVGNFEEVYVHIADDARWIIIEEAEINGKAAIIEECTQIANYFKSVVTNFNNLLY